MAINPSRAQARLTKGKAALDSITSLERRIRGWLDDQDQRQVTVACLEQKIHDLKGTLIPEKIDSPPNAENAPILEQIDALVQERDQVVLAYGQASKLLNEATVELESLRKANPHISPASVTAQEQALAKVEEAYPRLLRRHLYKCKRHGWTDNRMAVLNEHKAKGK